MFRLCAVPAFQLFSVQRSDFVPHRREALRLFFGLAFQLCCLRVCAEKPDPEVQLYNGPLEEIFDVRLQYSEEGQQRVEVETPVQYRYPKRRQSFSRHSQYQVLFDPSGGQVVTTLRSDSGRFDNARNLYIVKGNVVVVNKVGATPSQNSRTVLESHNP